MAPLLKDPSKALPESVDITIEQIDRWWDYWLLWRMSGKNVSSFVLMLGWEGALPKQMMDVFMELDIFFGKMEAQRMDDLAKKGKPNGR